MTKKGIDAAEAVFLLSPEGPALSAVLKRAGEARNQRAGRRVVLCAILNAKSGNCSQDCAFCAQSARRAGQAKTYPLRPADDIVAASERARAVGASRLGIVTSGRAVTTEKEIRTLVDAVSRIASSGTVTPCASLGLASEELLARLVDGGLRRYHHNIETAPSYYARVCSTRVPEDSFRTIERAKALGLATCCGGIFGLGENPGHRVEFLETLRRLDPDSVPLNFYMPTPGSDFQPGRDLTPEICLRLIAVTRLMMPDKEIRVCAGRDLHLGDRQGEIFSAGADGMMIGDYLTVQGRLPEDDHEMIREAGMEVDAKAE